MKHMFHGDDWAVRVGTKDVFESMVLQSHLSKTFKGKSVLITGGLGFIGSNLAHHLVKLGADVRIVDCLMPEQGGLTFNVADISDRVKVTVADLRATETLMEALAESRFLFSLAGQSSHWDSMADPYTDLDINCRAQLNLLEAIRQSNSEIKVVFASTRQIYGRPEYLPVDEEHPIRPVDINGIHRIATESYHELYARVYGLRCTILRLTNTIGPRMRVKDSRQTFAGLWIRRAVQGAPFEVWGGSQLRDFNYATDVVDAMLLAAASEHAEGRVYNLGSEPVTLRDLADILCKVTGGTYKITPFPEDRKCIDIGDYYASYERIQGDLGWEPRTSLDEALSQTVRYYQEHLDRYV